MNAILKTSMIIAAFAACVCTASAQESKKERPSRDKLAEIQARHIAADLSFDETTTKKFVALYMDCQKDLWELNKKKDNDKARPAKEATDEEIEKIILARFDKSQKILDLRREYYKKYREFLTARQVEQVYRQEKKLMNRLSMRGKRGKGAANAHSGAKPRKMPKQ